MPFLVSWYGMLVFAVGFLMAGLVWFGMRHLTRSDERRPLRVTTMVPRVVQPSVHTRSDLRELVGVGRPSRSSGRASRSEYKASGGAGGECAALVPPRMVYPPAPLLSTPLEPAPPVPGLSSSSQTLEPVAVPRPASSRERTAGPARAWAIAPSPR